MGLHWDQRELDSGERRQYSVDHIHLCSPLLSKHCRAWKPLPHHASFTKIPRFPIPDKNNTGDSMTLGILMGFPGGASGKEATCQCRRYEMWVGSLGREDPLKEGMTTHSSILA